MGSGKIVLVVDDDEDLRELLVRTLATKYTVYEAGDGQSAVDLLDTTIIPDAIICDVMMPGMDGYAVAQRVKSNANLRDVPIIFLTAKSSAADVIHGIQSGARHYVSKPFNVRELVEKVDRLLA